MTLLSVNSSAPAATSFIWTGNTGDNKWSTPGNWIQNTVPGPTQLAEFKAANCVGANCNVNVDVNANVIGISMAASYTGTITQGTGITMSVGTSGWTQSTGTFVGSNADLTITGGTFTLSGGTFTPPSTNFKILAVATANATVFTQSAGTYNAGTGTLAATGSLNVKGDLTYGTGTNGGTLTVTLEGTGNQNFSPIAGTALPTGTLTVNKASGKVISSATYSITTVSRLRAFCCNRSA